MRILITGGAGFIGSNFVHYLLNEYEDNEVITLDALTYAGSKDNLDGVLDGPRHEFVEGDIRDRELVSDLVADIDVIVNFAAESHVDRSIDGAKPFVSTNIQGTQTLLDAATEVDIDRFLQISTDEVYGQILDGKFAEDDQLNPRNPYAATKASADLLAQSFQTTHDLPVVITRTCNNFGPRQHPEKLIPKFIQNAADGKSLPVYGDGSNVREWIYIEDNCRALDVVLREGTVGEVYNIGSHTEKTNLEVTEEILNAVGASEDLIKFVEDRAGHDQRYALETEKINALGWEPEYTIRDGIEKTLDWYVENRNREYVRENLETLLHER
jgi:dTDP-glucose 4,6-dehydratase